MIIRRILLAVLIAIFTATSLLMVVVAIGGGSGLPTVSAHALNDSLSGFGTPKVDGVISSDEPYSCLGPIKPNPSWFTYRICEMNDARNNYYAVEISDTTNNASDRLGFYFDDAHDGVIPACTSGGAEDVVVVSGIAGGTTFLDQNYCWLGAGGGLDLPSYEPAQNGAGARSLGGLGSDYELSHPLCSGDGQDYCLKLGDTVGFCLAYDDYFTTGLINQGDFPLGCINPAVRNGDASRFGDLIVVSHAITSASSSSTTISTPSAGNSLNTVTTAPTYLPSSQSNLGINSFPFSGWLLLIAVPVAGAAIAFAIRRGHGKTTTIPPATVPPRASSQTSSQAKACPTCGQQMRIVEEYQSWWCDKCNSYKDLCPTCGQEMRFVDQYNSWWCDNCNAYKDQS